METIELFNVLPITYNLWKQPTLYPFFTILVDCSTSITHNQDAERRWLNFTWLKDTKAVVKEWVNSKHIDARTAKKFLTQQVTEFEETDFTCLLPMGVWIELDQCFNDAAVSVGIRKSISRVFCYLYYYAMRFQGSFSHSREQMLTELSMNNHTLADSLKWLEEHEFIVRSDYSMRPEERYARRYYIPEEYWNYACRKEWDNLHKIP